MLIAAIAIGIASTMTLPARAANVTPDVIFGSGNANGDFTVDINNNVELGLRAKQRFPAANIFNYNGVDTYTFLAGEGSPGRPLWNFEWSINTDLDGTSGINLADLTYSLRLDTDPGAGTTFTSFDPIHSLPFFDHSIGDNTTGNGAGVEATDAAEYAALLAANNVAQNSWAFNWFAVIDPLIAGLYTIELTASDVNGLLASTSINVNVIPIPAAFPLLAGALGLLGLFGWRRKRVAA